MIFLIQGVNGEMYGNRKGRIRKSFTSRLNKDKSDEVNWATGKQQFAKVYVLYRM